MLAILRLSAQFRDLQHISVSVQAREMEGIFPDDVLCTSDLVLGPALLLRGVRSINLSVVQCDPAADASHS